MRAYNCWQDVESHMTDLINAKRPVIGRKRNGETCLIFPIDITEAGQLKAIMLKYFNGNRGDGHIAYCDCDDFQEIEWDIADIPREEWEQYVA